MLRQVQHELLALTKLAGSQLALSNPRSGHVEGFETFPLPDLRLRQHRHGGEGHQIGAISCQTGASANWISCIVIEQPRTGWRKSGYCQNVS